MTVGAAIGLSILSGCVAASAPLTLPYEANPANYELVRGASAAHVSYDTRGFVEHSGLILVGTVSGASEPILIKPDSMALEGAKYFTDYYVEPGEVLFDSGEGGMASEIITVRTEGGAGNEVLMVSDDDPELKIGSQYLFFLERDYEWSRYNTGDDYYVIIGAINGTWAVQDAATFASRTGTDVIGEEELLEMIALYGGSKINEGDANHQAFLEEIRSREAAGELAPGSYQRYLDEEAAVLADRGKVLPASDKTAFEEALLSHQRNGEAFGYAS